MYNFILKTVTHCLMVIIINYYWSEITLKIHFNTITTLILNLVIDTLMLRKVVNTNQCVHYSCVQGLTVLCTYKLVKIIFVEVVLACVRRDCIVKPKQL